MRIGRYEARFVMVEAWPPGVFRAQGPLGRFVYLQLGVLTLELAALHDKGDQ